MTCNIFTIIKSYFVCCSKKEEPSKRYHIDSGENSPFTFDDLTLDNKNIDENSNSSSSSLSSLESYQLKDKQQQEHLKESLQRIKKYNQKLLHQRHYADVYQTSS
jgi:predicted transcriptional regulator